MVDIVVATALVAAGVAAITRHSSHVPGSRRVAQGASEFHAAARLWAADLPCPWCRSQTAENDIRCPSCGQRFG